MNRSGWGIDVLVEQADKGGGLEWYMAGEHLIEHHAQRINIGTSIDRPFIDLLRGHVIGGTDDLIGAGELGIGGQGCAGEICPGVLLAGVEKFRDAEI